MVTVERLEWDSEFFGVPIGQVDLAGVATSDLDAIDVQARDLGISCLYGTIMNPGPGDMAFRLQDHGHRLVEVNVKFDRPAGPYAPRPSSSSVRQLTGDEIGIVASSIDLLAPWSRFAADPRFGIGPARRLYDAWVRRAATSDDRAFLVAEDESGVTGLATMARGEPPLLDLLASTSPGSGAADVLTKGFLDWASEGAAEIVATHAGPCASRNLPICRFLERSGYRGGSVRYQFHRWLDDRTAT